MTQQFRQSVSIFKELIDKCIEKGGIFRSSEEVIACINANNQLFAYGGEHDELNRQNKELKEKIESLGNEVKSLKVAVESAKETIDKKQEEVNSLGKSLEKLQLNGK